MRYPALPIYLLVETGWIIPNMWRCSNTLCRRSKTANGTIGYMTADDPQLPKLLPGEEIINVQEFPALPKTSALSVVREIERLTDVSKGFAVGAFGPAMASKALPQRAGKDFHRYEALFGRDSLRVALNLLNKYPALARSTLMVLAQLQGVTTNNASEEEPGRIVHEVRDPQTDPIAQDFMREHGWQWPYYGSVDATPEYIRLLAAYCTQVSPDGSFLQTEYVGREGRVQTLGYSLKQAVKWITNRLDANPEWLLEFRRRNPNGIENQVWKDSWDAYFHADGTIASHERGIASVEVQRVAFDALLDAADIYERYLNLADEAADLRERAERLRVRLMDDFWTDEKGGYFILGTDRDNKGHLRKLKTRTSNMGHLLHSRLLLGDDPEIVRRREQLISQLFSPEMLSLNGIRTLASDEVRYRPGAYHNGSCWGWDNYIIAQGLALHGYLALSDYIEQTIIEDIDFAGRFVEFMRGGDDPNYRINSRIVDVWDANNRRINRLEQPPQDMQAWTVAAVYAINLERKQRGFSRLSPDANKHQFEQSVLRTVPARRRTTSAKIRADAQPGAAS